jgi:DNA-directed RNA polymerase specialized sigma24 family protein
VTSSDGIPAEALLDLRRRLDELPPRYRDRRTTIESTAGLFGVSRSTVYRALSRQLRPMGLRRADRGEPRKIPPAVMGAVQPHARKTRSSGRFGR